MSPTGLWVQFQSYFNRQKRFFNRRRNRKPRGEKDSQQGAETEDWSWSVGCKAAVVFHWNRDTKQSTLSCRAVRLHQGAKRRGRDSRTHTQAHTRTHTAFTCGRSAWSFHTCQSVFLHITTAQSATAFGLDTEISPDVTAWPRAVLLTVWKPWQLLSKEIFEWVNSSGFLSLSLRLLTQFQAAARTSRFDLNYQSHVKYVEHWTCWPRPHQRTRSKQRTTLNWRPQVFEIWRCVFSESGLLRQNAKATNTTQEALGLTHDNWAQSRKKWWICLQFLISSGQMLRGQIRRSKALLSWLFVCVGHSGHWHWRGTCSEPGDSSRNGSKSDGRNNRNSQWPDRIHISAGTAASNRQQPSVNGRWSHLLLQIDCLCHRMFW